MNKTFSSLIILLICVSILYGCNTHKNPNSDIDAVSPIKAEEFLKNKGYNIVNANGKPDSYVLSKEKLSSVGYSNIWGLQVLDVKSYIGKKVDTYEFTVKGHHLDNARDNNKHQTKVWIMLVDNAVIGGYSFPDYDEVHYGGVYSVDGKTLEEVTGLSFLEWSDRWKKDYNSHKSQKTSEQISKLIDDKLYAIISNPKHMASSNPYNYTKDNKDYEYIVNQGEKALEHMLGKFKNSNENGLKEYVMAIACSEILGEKPEQKNWSSGREWYEHYLKLNQNDTILSENKIDFNKDGREETIVVKMVDGRHYEDTNIGPFSGWKWEGGFDIELRDNGGKVLSTFDLNQAFSGEPLIFKDKFNIAFEDYNNDGCMDFTIGQYASSNGYEYSFFSIKKNGSIVLLPFDKSTGIFNDNNGYSTKFEKVDNVTFKNIYYDNSIGKRIENQYKWANDKFVKNSTAEIIR